MGGNQQQSGPPPVGNMSQQNLNQIVRIYFIVFRTALPLIDPVWHEEDSQINHHA